MTVVLVSYSRNKATLRPYASIDSTVAKALRPAPRQPGKYDSSDTTASSKTITAGTTQATLGAGSALRIESSASWYHGRFSLTRSCTARQNGAKSTRCASDRSAAFSVDCNFSNRLCASLHSAQTAT